MSTTETGSQLVRDLVLQRRTTEPEATIELDPDQDLAEVDDTIAEACSTPPMPRSDTVSWWSTPPYVFGVLRGRYLRREALHKLAFGRAQAERERHEVWRRVGLVCQQHADVFPGLAAQLTQLNKLKQIEEEAVTAAKRIEEEAAALQASFSQTKSKKEEELRRVKQEEARLDHLLKDEGTKLKQLEATLRSHDKQIASLTAQREKRLSKIETLTDEAEKEVQRLGAEEIATAIRELEEKKTTILQQMQDIEQPLDDHLNAFDRLQDNLEQLRSSINASRKQFDHDLSNLEERRLEVQRNLTTLASERDHVLANLGAKIASEGLKHPAFAPVKQELQRCQQRCDNYGELVDKLNEQREDYDHALFRTGVALSAGVVITLVAIVILSFM